ncbi:MAG TPA: uroporphyrinogen decarboxylase family protein [Clostridia bacterium]|nr:uroporphyrinogen decarboxylase family protein [Clostridia bacterium]
MTNREIILAGIKREKTPRLPVILLSSGVWTYHRNGYTLYDALTGKPEKIAEMVIRNNIEAGSDVLWTAADCGNVVLLALGAKCTFNKPGRGATVDEPLITCAEDVDKLDLASLDNSREIANLLETTRIISERVGKEYLIGISGWGPFTLGGQMMGVEKFMLYAITEPEEIQHILEFCTKAVIKYWELFLTAGAELVNQSDPSASGDMISPDMFKRLALPFIRAANTAIDRKAKAKSLHICGNTSKILDLVAESGTDMFSLDHKVDLALAAEKLGGKIAFAGQIDPVSVMLKGDPDDVAAAARGCIAAAGGKPGYILMPGCDVPPNTSIENVRAMVKVAHETKL